MPPRHRATAFAEACAVAADGAVTTTRWTGGVDGSIVRWETKTGDADLGERVAPVAFLGGHAGRVTALAVSEEDSLLLSGDDDGVVCAWDTRTNACVARRDFSGHAENPCAAVVSIEIKEKTSTSPPTKIARARFAGESPARALEPRTLRSVKDELTERFCSSGEETETTKSSVSETKTNTKDDRGATRAEVSANVLAAISFDPETRLADAWKTKAEPTRATSCRLLRGGSVGALAVGLEDGDVFVERLAPFDPETERSPAANGDGASEPEKKYVRNRVGTRVATTACIGGLLVAGDADGSVTFWDVDAEASTAARGASEEVSEQSSAETTSCRARPSLVASLRHHAREVRAVLALPTAAEDGDDDDDDKDAATKHRTRGSLGVSVDGEGVIGVFSVTDAPSRDDVRRANAPRAAKRARCEMLLRPMLRDALRDGVDGVDGVDDASVADVRLVWDRRRGVLTALRGYPSSTRSDDANRDVDGGVERHGSFSYDAVAYDLLGNTVERSIRDDEAALAFFAAAREAEGAAYARVGAETTTEFICSSFIRPDVEFLETPREREHEKPFENVESELGVGNVARALVVDVVALLERRDLNEFAHTRLRRVAAAMHAWGRDEDADGAARDAFFGIGFFGGKENETRTKKTNFCRHGYLVPAVLGVGRAVSVAVPSEPGGDFVFPTDPRSEAARAVAVAAIAARLAFVAAKKEKTGTETDRAEPKTASSSASLHAAVARLSTLQTFTTPEHLAAFARLRHSPCVPIQDAARALFHANAVAPASRAEANTHTAREPPPTRTKTLAESARAAVAAAEASLASHVAAERLGSTGARLESERAFRKAEALAEEAVDLSMPAVVAAATFAARAAAAPRGGAEDAEKTIFVDDVFVDGPSSPALVSRALIELLAAPRASIVADAASLLADAIESRGAARALSDAELAAALIAHAFALAEALGSVRAGSGSVADEKLAGSSFRVLGAPAETMTARDATGSLLAALAGYSPRAFLDAFAKRLKTAPADSPSHMSAFLALAKIARERPSALERHLDAVAGVVAAASSSSTPALRKTCRAGARALATDLAQHSGRVAYFASRNRDVERLAVAVEESAEESGGISASHSFPHFFSPSRGGGGSGIERRSIHVYDLVIGAKTKVLKEEDDETVVAADESGAAAAAAAYAARAANELSGAFSATLGALASPASNEKDAPSLPPRDFKRRSEDDTTVSKTVPRVRVEAFVEERSRPTSPSAASREGERRSPTANRARTTPIRCSVDVIPSPDPSDGNQQYAVAAAAAAMALAANQNHHTARRGHASRRSSPRASPRASPRVSSNFYSPKSVETRLAARLIATDATVDAQKAEGALPAFALAFDDDGSRLAGYRDAKSASRVRVWLVAPSSLFSRPSAFANLTSFGARVSGAVAGAAGASGIGGVGIPIPSAGFVSVGCAESFPCGDTAAMDDVLFGTDGNVNDASRNRASSARSQTIGPHKSSRSVSLEWRGGSAVVLRRGNVEAAFGVKKE